MQQQLAQENSKNKNPKSFLSRFGSKKISGFV